MKRLLFKMIIVNALVILGLGSCEKEDPSSSPVLNPPAVSRPPVTLPFTIDLVANNWVNYQNQVYVNTFRDVISSANVISNHTIKVYLEENGGETRIDNSPVTFMGYPLWAANSPTDVIIVYRCNAPTLPFSSLNIRVVVE